MSTENQAVPMQIPATKKLAELENRLSKKARWATAMACLSFLLAVSILWITNVPTNLVAEDIATLEGPSLRLNELSRPQSYEEEIRTIRTVQARVIAVAPFGSGIPEYEPREPADLLRHGRGLCFDRSRTIEKAFSYLGFRTRHVFLLYRHDHSLLSALVRRGHPSHAVTEVKTSKGWLYVDSNLPWIAVDRAGEPVGASGIWKQFDKFERPPEYVQGPWWAIRGLYSRKGAFYEPYFPLPQVNWVDFSIWTVEKGVSTVDIWLGGIYKKL